MTFSDFIISQNINENLFINQLKYFKRMNFNNNQFMDTDKVNISEGHFKLLSCETAQEIIDNKLVGLLNDKIHVYFYNEDKAMQSSVTFNYFHILFAAKEHLKNSLFELLNAILKETFQEIKDIPFKSGTVETIITKKMLDKNCKFIANYITIKNNRDYFKIIMHDEIILSNPYLLLLFIAPFDFYKVSKIVSLFKENNKLEHEAMLYTLSCYNIFRLADEVFDDSFVNFLETHNLLNSVRKYSLNPHNLKFQNEKSNFMNFTLNLTDVFYLKENIQLAEFLEKKGLILSFEPSKMLQIHKNLLKSEELLRGNFKEKIIMKIAYLENLVIKESIKDFTKPLSIKKRL